MRVEFYVDGSDKFIARVNDGQAPAVGDMFSIMKNTYRVTRVGWAIDNADDLMACSQRCCVELSSQP